MMLDGGWHLQASNASLWVVALVMARPRPCDRNGQRPGGHRSTASTSSGQASSRQARPAPTAATGEHGHTPAGPDRRLFHRGTGVSPVSRTAILAVQTNLAGGMATLA